MNRCIPCLMLSAFLLVFLAASRSVAAESLPRQHEDETLTVFAAASMGSAIEEISTSYRQQAGLRILVSIASSAALARQIERGARANVFISADRRWLNYLRAKGRLAQSGPSPLATNRLVIATVSKRMDSDLGPAQALLEDPKAWIAIGDPALSPLGAYTREALVAMGLVERLSGRLAFASDARAALALLRTGSVGNAILYESDARADHEIKIVATLEEALHTPIIYVAAAIDSDRPSSLFIRYILSPAGQAILGAHGFGPPPAQSGQE